MIEPRGCIEIALPLPLQLRRPCSTADQYVGCMQEVFGAEMDLRGGAPTGRLRRRQDDRAARCPHCQFSVEQAYQGQGHSYGCVNHRFFDCTDEGPEGLRAFDLRDAV